MTHDQLAALLRASDVTALATAFVADDGNTDMHFFGALGGEDIGANTRWKVASLTKPVLVYGALLLAQQGALDLDRPLQDYLLRPSLDDEPFLAQMTARHAMSHTTGLPNWRDAQGLHAAYAPGTKFSYSSEGMMFLQVVVEHLTGLPIDDYLQARVFTPLGMVDTQLVPETRESLPPYLHFLSGSLLANGALSLRTSVADYARFLQVMLRESAPLDSRWRDEMLRPQVEVANVPNLHWGLGWGLQTGTPGLSFWHWGARGIPRAMCFAVGIPQEQRGVVIFTDHTDGLLLCRKIVATWARTSDLPAFEWLLPAHEWRADGKWRAGG